MKPTYRRGQNRGQIPSLRYTYTLNRSNIDEHSYEAHGVTLTLANRF